MRHSRKYLLDLYNTGPHLCPLRICSNKVRLQFLLQKINEPQLTLIPRPLTGSEPVRGRDSGC